MKIVEFDAYLAVWKIIDVHLLSVKKYFNVSGR